MNTQNEVDGHCVSYDSGWIYGLENEEHFLCYQKQAALIYTHCSRSDTLLEIGIGTGLLADLLRRRGWRISTLDIDKDKNPDFCTDALSFNYQQEDVETVLAFEVFEHIPFSTLEKLLKKLSRHGVKEIYFSVPWNKWRLFNAYIRLAGAFRLHLFLGVPIGKIRTQNHFWELHFRNKQSGAGKNLVTIKGLKKAFLNNGFELTRSGQIGYIQFFSAKRINEHSINR